MNNLEILQESAIGECHMQENADYHIIRFNNFAVSVSPPIGNTNCYAVMYSDDLNHFSDYDAIDTFSDFASAMDFAANLLRENTND